LEIPQDDLERDLVVGYQRGGVGERATVGRDARQVGVVDHDVGGPDDISKCGMGGRALHDEARGEDEG